ncbi:MAG TPA: hypothetical protein VFZ95_03790 [Steroidobacteraceae bacterium]
MKRLRTLRFRYWAMPVILAALAARAFMPAGFMSMPGEDGMSATIAMCSQDKARRERIDFPGQQSPGEHRLQCKHCLAPVLGAPFAFYDFSAPATPLSVLVPGGAQLAFSPLLRSQEARAPPHA